VKPEIAASLHFRLFRDPVHHHTSLDAGTLGHGRICVRLAAQDLAGTIAPVAGDEGFRLAVLNPVPQCLGAESAEYDTVNGPDPCTRKHYNGKLHDHGQIDGYPVSFFHPEFLQHVGELANLPMKLLVGKDSGLLQRLALKDESRLVFPPGLEMAVQAVVGYIEFSANKVAEKDVILETVFLDGSIPWLEPVDHFLGHVAPEACWILDGPLPHLFVLIQALDAGLIDKILGWIKHPLFHVNRLNTRLFLRCHSETSLLSLEVFKLCPLAGEYVPPCLPSRGGSAMQSVPMPARSSGIIGPGMPIKATPALHPLFDSRFIRQSWKMIIIQLQYNYNTFTFYKMRAIGAMKRHYATFGYSLLYFRCGRGERMDVNRKMTGHVHSK